MAKAQSKQVAPVLSISVGVKELITFATIAMSPFVAFCTMLKNTNDRVVELSKDQGYNERRFEKIEKVIFKAVDVEKLQSREIHEE